MVRLVLFDIDGTLIRTAGAGVRAFAKVFATEFNGLDGIERLNFAGRTDLSLLREFFGRHHLPMTPENLGRFFDHYVFWLDQILRESHAAVCPGVREFLPALKALPKPPLLGLLTGNVRLGAEIKLRHLGLWDWFAVGAFSDDHEERDQIAAIARRRGCQALQEDLRDDQVLVIGDTVHDIRCARAIGAKVLAVATGGCSLEELRAHSPDWAAPDLTHVSAPALIVGEVPPRRTQGAPESARAASGRQW